VVDVVVSSPLRSRWGCQIESGRVIGTQGESFSFNICKNIELKKTLLVSSTYPRTDVVILKYFRQKIGQKTAYLLKLLLVLLQQLIIT
jgi:hypothetical protein